MPLFPAPVAPGRRSVCGSLISPDARVPSMRVDNRVEWGGIRETFVDADWMDGRGKEMKMKTLDSVKAGIIGLAVADALGVPVEFSAREERRRDPVADMRGFGVHNQPTGTWSDDTSMALCLLESLSRGLDYADIMDNFVKWYRAAFLTAGDAVFDVGGTTRRAILRYEANQNPLTCGQSGEWDAGNGSLMRILPLAFYLDAKYGYYFAESPEAMEIVRNVSSLTHAHMRCVIACGIYLAVAQELLRGAERNQAVDEGIRKAAAHYGALGRDWRAECEEHYQFDAASLLEMPETRVASSGYVVDTLLAALWCLLTTDSYEACALRAVNLGSDTDTVAAVAGGLAGLCHGYDTIPERWREQLIRRDRIEALCEVFARACGGAEPFGETT
jgi:ADP-ribosylglycohydrolase